MARKSKANYPDTIGVIGVGFVGGAVVEGMKWKFNVETYDRFNAEKSTCGSIKELASKANEIFVCVPTPYIEGIGCDTSIVESVLVELDKHSISHIAIVKSTIAPGTCDQLLYGDILKCLKIVFNPEFLTEANAASDFATQDRIVLGGERCAVSRVAEMYSHAFPDALIVRTSFKVAEMVKYVTNVYLATKVSLANELYQVCDALGIDYDEMIEIAQLDARLGKTHWKVPGPISINDEPTFGWGLSCFPKDLRALAVVARSLGVEPMMMDAAWKKNIEVRKPEHRDWETMERAVGQKKKC